MTKLKVARRSKVCLLFRAFLIITTHRDSLLRSGIDQNVEEAGESVTASRKDFAFWRSHTVTDYIKPPPNKSPS